MDTDLVLVLGLILMCLAIPAGFSSFSDRRPLTAPLITMVIAAGMIAAAVLVHPEGYAIAQVPEVFFGVLARIIP